KKGERVEGRIFRFKGDSFFVGLNILPAEDKFCGKGVPVNFWDKLPYPANMPVGEVDIDDPRPYRRWLGRKMPMKIVSIGQDGDVIVSRKKIIVEMKDAIKQEALNTVKAGDVMAAKVKVIDIDGVKVDVDGVEGAMPAVELSWYPKPDPRRILKRGQTIDVKVTKVDKEKGIVHVSHRAILTHPAEELVRKFPAKTIIEGTVERVLERGGCFISMPGIKREAYMPANEAVDDVAKKKGEKIKATVLRVDRENVRVVVSQRRYESAQMPNMVARYSKENQQLTLGDILGAMNLTGEEE
ncbi:MAG: S1 RNA-binding domain-containing protein, partial [Elusimicrobiota bacterium]